ncbi:chorion class CB protein PC404-like [Cydia pomonella]|uniref:chorion class CB protein PC404-like n=1 Tax=Cydia pomonella TaxID=82600 RepID=UPI002ADDB039|nr:chorion class CB protein PC404-like [Cydia pomonella]
MSFKAALLCVVACLVQLISYNPIRPTKYLSNSASIDVASYGGALAVSSIGPISPSGIAVATDLGLAGDVVLSGELPYLSAVAFEGQFATAGAVPVAYGCGDYVGITEQIRGIAGSGSYIGGNIGASSYGSSYLGCGCKY